MCTNRIINKSFDWKNYSDKHLLSDVKPRGGIDIISYQLKEVISLKTENLSMIWYDQIQLIGVFTGFSRVSSTACLPFLVRLIFHTLCVSTLRVGDLRYLPKFLKICSKWFMVGRAITNLLPYYITIIFHCYKVFRKKWQQCLFINF